MSLFVHRKRPAALLFLIGVFSFTQISIGGKIGISEFPMVILAPFLFVTRLDFFRRNNLMPLCVLLLLWLCGAIYSDYYNNMPFAFSIRGMAVPIVLFSAVVCLSILLHDHLQDFKWLLLGVAISSVLSVFVFQRGRAGDLASNAEPKSLNKEVL